MHLWTYSKCRMHFSKLQIFNFLSNLAKTRLWISRKESSHCLFAEWIGSTNKYDQNVRSKSYEFFNKWERDSERERGRDDLLNRYLLSKDLKDGRKSARGTHSFQRVKRFSSLREKERESRGRQAQSFSPSLLGTYLSSTYILSIFFLSLVHTFINFHSHTLLTLSLSPIPLLTDCTQPPCKALTHMFWEDMFSLFLSTYLSCSLDFYLSRGEISDISTRSVPYLPTYLPTYLLTYLPTYA